MEAASYDERWCRCARKREPQVLARRPKNKCAAVGANYTTWRAVCITCDLRATCAAPKYNKMRCRCGAFCIINR